MPSPPLPSTPPSSRSGLRAPTRPFKLQSKPDPTAIPKVSSYRFDTSQLLIIRVGIIPCREFAVHQSFLTTRSEFFRRAMNPYWEEAESRIIKLPEDNADTFAAYLDTVYTGQLHLSEESSTPEQKYSNKSMRHEYNRLFNVYILAEKLQDTTAKNIATTVIFNMAMNGEKQEHWTVPSLYISNKIYQKTVAGSPARQLVAGFWASRRMMRILELSQDLEQDLLEDIAKIIDEQRHVHVRQVKTWNIPRYKGLETYLEVV